MARICILGTNPQYFLRFRSSLATALISRGHEVVAALPNNELKEEIEELGVKHAKYYLAPVSLNPFKDIRTFFSLIILFRKHRCECVLSSGAKPVVYGSLAAHIAGVNKIYSMLTGLGYAFIPSTFKQRIIRFILSAQYRQALKVSTVVFFHNQDDISLLEKLEIVSSQKACVVNGSGVDTQHYSPRPSNSTSPTFTFVGRLLRDKGIFEFVESARIIKEKYPNAKFQIVGALDKNPSSVTQETIQKWVGGGLVDYIGTVDDVRPYLSDCTAFVLPSYREGLSRSTLEAMAMGKPIITTDAPGCRQTVIDGKNGYLVPIQQPVALADAIEKTINDVDLTYSMGLESRKYCENNFEVGKVVDDMIRAMKL